MRWTRLKNSTNLNMEAGGNVSLMVVAMVVTNAANRRLRCKVLSGSPSHRTKRGTGVHRDFPSFFYAQRGITSLARLSWPLTARLVCRNQRTEMYGSNQGWESLDEVINGLTRRSPPNHADGASTPRSLPPGSKPERLGTPL